MRDDLYSERREVTVDSEQAEEADDISVFEEESKNEGDGDPSVSAGSSFGWENIGGWGMATEARRRSW